MNDFAALLLTRQNEHELQIALEQRRLLLESKGRDPRFHRSPSLWQRVRGTLHSSPRQHRNQALAPHSTPTAAAHDRTARAGRRPGKNSTLGTSA